MNKPALLVVFLAPLLTTSMVRADTKEEARKHFDRAVELVDDGQLEGALVELFGPPVRRVASSVRRAPTRSGEEDEPWNGAEPAAVA